MTKIVKTTEDPIPSGQYRILFLNQLITAIFEALGIFGRKEIIIRVGK
ncbi:MAG: hypothetical protein WCT08_02705 [Patescibacteria group bacterium]